MSLPRTLSVFTADQYLDLERHTELRHEFLDGIVYAMSGASRAHSHICYNLAVLRTDNSAARLARVTRPI